ncbi:hypothetical protein O7621_12365 [Solwaraspora sp. WMMD937]|uniref:hypothetical protein n=1 Tax=Solwaraspora sp. WMMD937 TaxID=3016090 RepID=UPI00249C7CA9|nr:hypothetical protein [Solwaraspora sp. WMMD937]WFE23989.1 hypothetical protein O7621_12365 [Solwaraspora sp. WMMD937]
MVRRDSSTGPARLALLLAGVAVGYLLGRRTRSGGTDVTTGPAVDQPTAGAAVDPPTTHPAATGPVRVRPAVAPAGQRPGTDLGYHPGRPADEEFAADVVSGSSATTASHPYQVPAGRTTATPAAPVGDPVVPTGADGDERPPPERRRPDPPRPGV